MLMQSNRTFATRHSALAFSLSIMMSGTVITGEFFSRFNIDERIKFYEETVVTHISVGLAGMIDETELIACNRSIKSFAIPQFNERDGFFLAGQLPALSF